MDDNSKLSLLTPSLDSLMSFMIDIARHGGALIEKNIIIVEDSVEFSEFIKEIAKKFAEGPLCRRWDYYAVIDEFAHQQLTDRYGNKAAGKTK